MCFSKIREQQLFKLAKIKLNEIIILKGHKSGKKILKPTFYVLVFGINFFL